MAKFELPIFDSKTGEVKKSLTRDFMPVSTYVKFQKLAETVDFDTYKNDEEFFKSLKPCFLEMFPELTEKEFENNTDIAYILKVFGDVINKSTQFTNGNSKNG